MQPERDHNFQSNGSWVGALKGRKYREARGRWMSCEMKINNYLDLALFVDYFGGYPGSKPLTSLLMKHLLPLRTFPTFMKEFLLPKNMKYRDMC